MNRNILRILLVEDDDDHAELIKRTLEQSRLDYKLFHAKDGQDALDYLLRRNKYNALLDEYPNLILLDLHLPKVDGFEVLKKIKNIDVLTQIPVVILTSSEAEKDIAMAYENHADGYLIKPLDFESFAVLMKKLENNNQ